MTPNKIDKFLETSSHKTPAQKIESKSSLRNSTNRSDDEESPPRKNHVYPKYDSEGRREFCIEKSKKPRKARTAFTDEQLAQLESSFEAHK